MSRSVTIASSSSLAIDESEITPAEPTGQTGRSRVHEVRAAVVRSSMTGYE